MAKKIITALLLMILSSITSVFAETIVLKSGKTIEGKIINKTDKYIKMDISGIPITYYLDDIESIDGNRINSFVTIKTAGNVEPTTAAKSGEKIAGESFVPKRKGDLIIHKFTADKPYADTVHQGNIYIDQGQYSQAIELFKKGIEINPNLPDAYVGIACVYDRLNKVEEAVEILKKALEIAPDNPTVYADLGFMYYRLGKFQEAKINLQKGKELYEKQGMSQGIGAINEVLTYINSKLK